MKRWTDRRHLAIVLLAVLAIDSWVGISRYRTATWMGREPLPTFLAGDGPMYRATLLSLVGDADLDVRNQFEQLGYPADSRASLGVRGEWFPKHPIVMPIVSAPWYLIFGNAGLLAFNILQLAALAALMWLLARRFSTAAAATIATLVFMLGTMLRPAAYNWSPDVLSTTIAMAALLALFTGRHVASALLLALAVAAKLPNVLMLPAFAVFVLYTSPVSWRRFGIAAAAGLAVIAAMNWWMFGSPVTTSYDRVIAAIQDGRVVLEPSHRTFFDVPILDGLSRQMFDGGKGLLASAPALPAAMLGLVALYARSAPAALLVAAIMLSQILFFAPYRLWDQSNFGHRFLLTVIALGAVPFAALVDSLRPSAKRA